MPKISVVVPVYNAEKFLAECFESVLSQDFDSFEIVAVDDGSPDSSGALCDDFARRDARVSVVHKENGGVTAARKIGVERSRGEWICFVDADDALLPHALSTLFAVTQKFPEADIVEGSCVRFRDNPSEPFRHRNDDFSWCGNEPLVVDGLAYAKRLATQDQFFATGPREKIIRRDVLLKKRALDVPADIIFGEDIVMLFSVATAVRCVVRIQDEVYAYRKNSDGMCDGKVTQARYRTPEYTQKWYEAMRTALAGKSDAWQDVWKIAVAATLPDMFRTSASRESFLKNPRIELYFPLLLPFAGMLAKGKRQRLEMFLLGRTFPFSLLPETVFRALMQHNPFRYVLLAAARLRRICSRN